MSFSEPGTAAVGFLTVIEEKSHGLFGGYLILNPAGRPVEFHCTAPVKPNRAQEILYGPTLKPYLYGEQIARTLIQKSKIMPRMVCFDQECVLCVRPFLSTPAVLVERREENVSESGKLRWKDQLLSPFAEFNEDLTEVQACLKDLFIEFDLLEPFDRIRDAIAEAQKAAG
ncbi:MAG: hypothetical protein Q4D98_09195 [Planctomycetia bacterium]|nr:hypothetical protein [Planctomycetia bacterium]